MPHKGLFVRPVSEQCEVALFLADLVLIEDDQIMVEIIELQLLQRRHDLCQIMSFIKDSKGQHEDRVIGVDLNHTVIPTFIDIHDEFAEPTLFADIRYLCLVGHNT